MGDKKDTVPTSERGGWSLHHSLQGLNHSGQGLHHSGQGLYHSGQDLHHSGWGLHENNHVGATIAADLDDTSSVMSYSSGVRYYL